MSSNSESSQSSLRSSKAVAGGLAGALTVVLVWIAGMFNVDVPPEVSSAITTLIAGGAVWLKKE
jgi:hypothetical protein